MPSPTRASGFSTSRSATIRSASSRGASLSEAERVTSWPAAFSMASTLLASIRSEEIATILAISWGTRPPLQGAALAELFADALGPAPHLDELGPALAHLAQLQLAGDPLGVEPGEHSPDALSRGRVAKALGDEQPPVPVGLGVGLGVDLAEPHRAVDVAALVVDAEVELEVRPVGGKRVEDELEVVGERHRRKPSRCRWRPRPARRSGVAAAGGGAGRIRRRAGAAGGP